MTKAVKKILSDAIAFVDEDDAQVLKNIANFQRALQRFQEVSERFESRLKYLEQRVEWMMDTE